RKGLGDLLRAYRAMSMRIPQTRLIIVGDGPLRGRVESYVARHRLPNVVVAGYVPDSVKPRYYNSADIFCAPATGAESFGIVLLEALASGLPVVATEVPGYMSVLESGRDSVTVQPKNWRELAASLVILARDAELRRRAGVVLLFAGTCDILDGALARSTHASYPYGAFLDSTLDRYSEGAVYLGLAAYFVTVGGTLQEWLVLATLAALAGSFLVSYVRARAQSLGFVCKTGLFQRPERVVVTVVGLLVGGYVLYGVVFLLAIVTNIT